MAKFITQQPQPSGSSDMPTTPGAPTSQGSNQNLEDILKTFPVPTSTSETTPVSSEGFNPFSVIGNMAQDAFKTLVVKPATRIGEAAASAAEPLMPPEMQQNVETNLKKPQTTLGQTIEPQRTGVEGAKQISGDALKSFAYLYGGEGLANIGPEGNLASKFMEGGTTGMVSGSAGGAGNELETNPKANVVSTLNAAAEGGVAGFGLGGLTGAAVGGAKETFNPTPEHVQARALSDVMPSAKDVLADNAPRDIAGQPRLKESSGLFGDRKPTPTQLEQDAATELTKIPGYQKAIRGTALDRFNSTTKPLDALNVKLKTSLGQESFLQSADDLYKKMLGAVEKESQTNPVLGTKVENQGLEGRIGNETFNVNNYRGTKFGDQLASQAPSEPSFTDPGMNRYLQVLKSTIKSVFKKGDNGGMGNLADELEVKQRMDNYHKNSSGGRGKEFLSQADAPTKTLAIMNGTTRDALTEDIASNAKSTAVKPILKQEWDLLRARDMLWDKAGNESATRVGRFVQGLPGPVRQLGRRALIGGAVAASGLYAAARTLAPKSNTSKLK